VWVRGSGRILQIHFRSDPRGQTAPKLDVVES